MASDKVSFHFSDGWDEVLRYCIELNNNYLHKKLSLETDKDGENAVTYKNGLRLNEKLKSTIDKYMSEDGKITLYNSEVRRLVWLLLENEFNRIE